MGCPGVTSAIRGVQLTPWQTLANLDASTAPHAVSAAIAAVNIALWICRTGSAPPVGIPSLVPTTLCTTAGEEGEAIIKTIRINTSFGESHPDAFCFAFVHCFTLKFLQ